MEGQVGRQFVGIDLHRRRSVIVRTRVNAWSACGSSTMLIGWRR